MYMNLVFPFSKPIFFNSSISMLLLYIIFNICFCMDNKTSLSFSQWPNWALELMPHSARTAGAGPALLSVWGWPGCSWFSLLFSSLIQRGQGKSVYAVTQLIKRNFEGADLISVPPNLFVPQLSVTASPLLCLPSLCSGGIWGWCYCVNIPACSTSPRDSHTGEGKGNKTKIQLELNSKGKEQKSNCSLGTLLLEGFLKGLLTDTTNYLQGNKCTVEKFR